MKKKKVSSTDVARLAGVSQATVSMVLNQKYNVSFAKETIAKVEAAAGQLGYELPGRKLQSSRQAEKLLIVLTPNLSNPYYVMLIEGIEARATERGLGIYVCNTQRSLKLEEYYLKMIKRLAPSGVIYTFNPGKQFQGFLEKLGRQVPVAVINNQNEKIGVDMVELDNLKLGRIMAEHLLELGHRKVAYLATPLTARQKQRAKRIEGFVECFAAAGCKDGVVIRSAPAELDSDSAHIDSEYKIGYELTKELLQTGTEVTAIVGLNDMIAFGILDALAERKIRVPQEMSVMGCDNTLFSRLAKVSLTTIEHFVIYKGRDACDIVLKKMESRQEQPAGLTPISTYHVEYEPELIVRGTTSYPREKRLK